MEQQLFRCEFEGCTKAYKLKGDLQVHVRVIHDPSAKVFVCRRCGRNFNYKHVLKRHELCMHGILDSEQLSENSAATDPPPAAANNPASTAVDALTSSAIASNEQRNKSYEDEVARQIAEYKSRKRSYDTGRLIDVKRQRLWAALLGEQGDERVEGESVNSLHIFSRDSTCTSSAGNSTTPSAADYWEAAKDSFATLSTDAAFKCPYPHCLRSFVRQSSLRFHYRNVHLEPRSFVCSSCGMKFNYKHVLQRHETKMHGVVSEALSEEGSH